MDPSYFEQAQRATEVEAREWYSRYINPDYMSTLTLVGFDKLFVKAEGCVINDGEHDYYDFSGGFGSLNVGHNNPEVAEALKQVMQEPNILQICLRPYAAALGKALSEVLPGDLEMTFFCNSGAEAVEGALKMARIATARQKIIATDLAFHGKTFGALSASGKKKYRDPFMPLVPDFVHIPFGDIESLSKELELGDKAAFIVEPVQGEAGIIVPPDGYLAKAAELCHRYGALLIADEVQTGFGRTGKMFACEYDGVIPDIICMAKALSGGYIPSGAFSFSKKLWERSYSGLEKSVLHTSTFGGNTMAAVAGLKAIDILIRNDQELVRQAKEKGDYFLDKAMAIKDKGGLIKDIRGRGLMIGIEFTIPPFIKGAAGDLYHQYFAALVASELFSKHRILTVYTLNNPNVIRIEPPLTVTYEMLDVFIAAVEEICSKSWASELVEAGVKAGVRAVKSWVRKKT